MIKLSEIPPSANSLRNSFVRDGKVISAKTDRYRSWRDLAAWEIAAQKPVKVSGPYCLTIAVERQLRTKLRRDIDNLIKPISDALVASGVVGDDSLAECVSACWSDSAKGVEIELEAI